MSFYGYAVVVVHPSGNLEAWDSMLSFARERNFNPSTVSRSIADRGEFCFNGSVVRRVKLNEKNKQVERPSTPVKVSYNTVLPPAPTNLFNEGFII